MRRTSAIAVLAAALAIAHAGSASAWIILNGGSENGVTENGTGENGGGPNGGGANGGGANGGSGNGASANGAADVRVIAIELPAPVTR